MGLTLDATPTAEEQQRLHQMLCQDIARRNTASMTARHYIATQLLAGIMTGRIAAGYNVTGTGSDESDRRMAKRAVALTDILIEELVK